MINHNCTLEGSFEFVSIAVQRGQKTIIKCKVCGSKWVKVEAGLQ